MPPSLSRSLKGASAVVVRNARAVVSRARLRPLLNTVVPRDRTEIRLFMKVRNEAAMLPEFLDYHKRLGVDRFFVVDNGSSDDTVAVLAARPDCHVFSTSESLKYHPVWIDALLREFGLDQWCVVLDADERLVYPGSESVSLKVLRSYLEESGFNAMNAILLDMYSDQPIRVNHYHSGLNPVSVWPYFDPEWQCDAEHRPCGGVRQRVFGISPALDKVPFFRFQKNMRLSVGAHVLSDAREADVTGAILHFKFSDAFADRVSDAISRGVYWKNSSEYRAYASALQADPELNLHYQGSRRYRSSEDLVHLGIAKNSEEFGQFLAERGICHFSKDKADEVISEHE